MSSKSRTKPTSAVGCLEGRDVIQKVCNRLRQWDNVILMKRNVAKFKVLHLVWSNAKHNHRLGNEGVESTLMRRTWNVGG